MLICWWIFSINENNCHHKFFQHFRLAWILWVSVFLFGACIREFSEIMFFIQVLHNFIVKMAFGHHNSLKQFIKLKFIGKYLMWPWAWGNWLTHNSNKNLPTKKSIKHSENREGSCVKEKFAKTPVIGRLGRRKLQKKSFTNPQC